MRIIEEGDEGLFQLNEMANKQNCRAYGSQNLHEIQEVTMRCLKRCLCENDNRAVLFKSEVGEPVTVNETHSRDIIKMFFIICKLFSITRKGAPLFVAI